MQAVRIEQPNQVQLVDLAEPQPAPGQVLIHVRASGICGTDVHILRGEYLGGYPVIPGHEFAGEVVAVGSSVTRFKPGDHVAVEPNIACDNCFNCLHNRQNFCLNWQAVGVTLPGGMAQYVLAPEKAVFDIGDLPFEAGAFMEPLSCVIHGVERASIRMGDRVAILGAGPIGNLLLQVIRAQGAAELTLVDKNIARLEAASAAGADRCLPDAADLETDAYDVVVDATGFIPLMQRSIEFARPGGTVLLFGVPPSGKGMTLEAFKIFQKGLKLMSSFTSLRNSYQAIAMLQTGAVDVSRLISHRLPLDGFAHGVELIERGQENVLKVQIIPAGH